jgi:hypothetical protein
MDQVQFRGGEMTSSAVQKNHAGADVPRSSTSHKNSDRVSPEGIVLGGGLRGECYSKWKRSRGKYTFSFSDTIVAQFSP